MVIQYTLLNCWSSPRAGQGSSPGSSACFDTKAPTSLPTSNPTTIPSNFPRLSPTHRPSRLPSSSPTVSPITLPTTQPSYLPTGEPTDAPTDEPTRIPTITPTPIPTFATAHSPSGQVGERFQLINPLILITYHSDHPWTSGFQSRHHSSTGRQYNWLHDGRYLYLVVL